MRVLSATGGFCRSIAALIVLPPTHTIGLCEARPNAHVTTIHLGARLQQRKRSPHTTSTVADPTRSLDGATPSRFEGVMVRMPVCVGLGQPWIEPSAGYIVDDATESHTHAPSSVAYPVWVDTVLANRYRCIMVVMAPEKYLLRISAVHKAVGSTVRVDVAVTPNKDARRSNFLVFTSLNPGVAQSDDFMIFDAKVLARHPGGLVVHNMLVDYDQQPAVKLFNCLKRGAPRMVAGPANGPTVGAADLNAAMSIGKGYSLVPNASAPYVGDGSLVFWPRSDWDQRFRQLVASVCSSAASSNEPPVDLVHHGWAVSGTGTVPPVGAVASAGAGEGVGTAGADAAAVVVAGASVSDCVVLGDGAASNGAEDA